MSNKLYCIVCNDGNSCYCALEEEEEEEQSHVFNIQPVNPIIHNNISNMPNTSNLPHNMTYITNQFNNMTINNS